MDNSIPSRAPEPALPVDDTGIDPDKNRIQKRHRSNRPVPNNSIYTEIT